MTKINVVEQVLWASSQDLVLQSVEPFLILLVFQHAFSWFLLQWSLHIDLFFNETIQILLKMKQKCILKYSTMPAATMRV